MNSIAAGDYGFYTQGNARYVDTAQLPNTQALASLDANSGAPSHSTAPARSQSAAASNYRSLRDSDNRYNIAGGPGQPIWYYLDWTPSTIKINQGTPNSLIGTDNADSMDAAYYATYLGSTYAKFFNLDQLTNFYAGDDRMYGEEGDDVLLGQDGNDFLIDAVSSSSLLAVCAGRVTHCMLFA